MLLSLKGLLPDPYSTLSEEVGNYCLPLCGPDSHSCQPREFRSGWAPFPHSLPMSPLAMTSPGSSLGKQAELSGQAVIAI